MKNLMKLFPDKCLYVRLLLILLSVSVEPSSEAPVSVPGSILQNMQKRNIVRVGCAV